MKCLIEMIFEIEPKIMFGLKWKLENFNFPLELDEGNVVENILYRVMMNDK